MPEVDIVEPTSAERGYAKLIWLVLQEAPSREHAMDHIAKALAHHRARTVDVCTGVAK